MSHDSILFAQVGDLCICYETFGDPSQPPMLLVAGLGCQMIEWDDALCEQLAAAGFWVIRYDNRDVGLSTKLDAFGIPDLQSLPTSDRFRQPQPHLSPPYTLRDMAADGIGLLDELGIASAHVVGISMGGMIVQHMAIHWPHRLRSMASIMSSSGDPSLPGVDARIQPLIQPDPIGMDAFVNYYVTWEQAIGGPHYPRSADYLRRMAQAIYLRGRHAPGKARQTAAIRLSPPWHEALGGVTTPTLVIHGDVDPLLPLAHGEDTARRISHAELLVIKGWGHGYPAPALWPQLIQALARHAKQHDHP